MYNFGIVLDVSLRLYHRTTSLDSSLVHHSAFVGSETAVYLYTIFLQHQVLIFVLEGFSIGILKSDNFFSGQEK